MNQQTKNQHSPAEFLATPKNFKFKGPGAEIRGTLHPSGVWTLDLGIDEHTDIIQIGRFAIRDNAKAVARWLSHQPPDVIKMTHRINIEIYGD